VVGEAISFVRPPDRCGRMISSQAAFESAPVGQGRLSRRWAWLGGYGPPPGRVGGFGASQQPSARHDTGCGWFGDEGGTRSPSESVKVRCAPGWGVLAQDSRVPAGQRSCRQGRWPSATQAPSRRSPPDRSRITSVDLGEGCFGGVAYPDVHGVAEEIPTPSVRPAWAKVWVARRNRSAHEPAAARY